MQQDFPYILFGPACEVTFVNASAVALGCWPAHLAGTGFMRHAMRLRSAHEFCDWQALPSCGLGLPGRPHSPGPPPKCVTGTSFSICGGCGAECAAPRAGPGPDRARHIGAAMAMALQPGWSLLC